MVEESQNIPKVPKVKVRVMQKDKQFLQYFILYIIITNAINHFKVAAGKDWF